MLFTMTKLCSSRRCSQESLSFFQSFACPDGTIGIESDCKHPIKLSSSRSYLPNINFFSSKGNHSCDEYFSEYLDKYIWNGAKYKYHQGYPQDINCKIKSCHEPSIGKYMRYNSFINYFRFHKLSFDKNVINNTLYNIEHKNFRWSSNIDTCKNHTNGWECIFLPMSKSHERLHHQLHDIFKLFSHARLHKFDNLTAFNEDELMSLYHKFIQYRHTNKNSVVQIMIYGKLLDLLLRPNNLLLSYFKKYIQYQPKKLSNKNINNYNSHKKVVSVSMHVRHGDSCDVKLGRTHALFPNISDLGDLENGLDKYLHQWAIASGIPKTNRLIRPCFSPEIYLRKLNLLHIKYGVNTVFLATDSEEMIELTKLQTNYTWVYINSSKSFATNVWIDYSHGKEEDILFSAVADLQLLKHGDMFLGAFTSHYSKLAYYLMAGYQMRIPPFISLDYPLSCDTIDDCSNEDIRIRNQTVEEIIYRSAECERPSQRRISYMGDTADSCGVYYSSNNKE